MKHISLSLAAALLLLGMVPAFACEGENMIYEDSFHEDDGFWKYDGDVKLEDGKLILSPKPGSGAVAVNVAEIYDDLDLCVTMTFIKAAKSTWSPGSVVFWAAKKNLYMLMVNADGSFGVGRSSRGKPLIAVPRAKNANIKTGEGAVNHLRVLLVGKQAKVFINGEEAASFKGRPPKGGSIVGLGAAPPKGGRSVFAFDDFKVAEPAASVASLRKSAPSDQDASRKAERTKAARATPSPSLVNENARAVFQLLSQPAMKK